MKHLIFILAFLFAGLAYAAPGANFGDHLNQLDVLPIAAVTSSGNGTAVDLQQYAGQIAVIVSGHNVAGTTPTMDLKLQDSPDNSTFTDVSGGAFTQMTTSDSNQKIVLNKDSLNRYLRIVKTIGGTSSPQYLLAGKVLAIKKYPQ